MTKEASAETTRGFIKQEKSSLLLSPRHGNIEKSLDRATHKPTLHATLVRGISTTPFFPAAPLAPAVLPDPFIMQLMVLHVHAQVLALQSSPPCA